MHNIAAVPRGSDGGPLSDEVALVRAAREEPSAFGTLYDRYLGRIYAYLRARSSNDEEAADLTQQVFLQALDALPRYREGRVPFAAWLFRIARNAAIDSHRRRRTSVRLRPTKNGVMRDGGPADARRRWRGWPG